MASKSTQQVLEELIKLGVESGIIALKNGITPEAARKILENAVAAGLDQIPENMTLSLGDGQYVEIPFDAVAKVGAQITKAGIAALVEALSPGSTKVQIDGDVAINWTIE